MGRLGRPFSFVLIGLLAVELYVEFLSMMAMRIFKGWVTFPWFKKIKINTITRMTVTIKLLGEAGAAPMIWTLQNAWPGKISGKDLNADGSETTTIDRVEIMPEGILPSGG